MKIMSISKGYFVRVDDCDFDNLSRHKWTASVSGRNNSLVYAYRHQKIDGKIVKIYMHRQIMLTPSGLDTDHIDGDTLNNTRANLRQATRSQNNANRLFPDNSTEYRGVRLEKATESKPYRAMCRGKHLGRFHCKIEAARVYDAAALKEYGEFAKLNFPVALEAAA